MIVKPSKQIELSRQIKACVTMAYKTVPRAAEELGIPKNRLTEACVYNNVDALRVSDLKKIAPLLPEQWRDALREYALP